MLGAELMDWLPIVVPAIAAVLLAFIGAKDQRGLTSETLKSQGETTKATLDAQTQTTQLTLDHQHQLARDERVQERIARVYEDMLEYVQWGMEILDRTFPLLEYEGQPEPPEPPSSAEARQVGARVGAHASAEVKDPMHEWREAVREFNADAWLLKDMRKEPDLRATSRCSYTARCCCECDFPNRSSTRTGIVRRLEDRVNVEFRS